MAGSILVARVRLERRGRLHYPEIERDKILLIIV
jgi:hypothetical protein